MRLHPLPCYCLLDCTILFARITAFSLFDVAYSYHGILLLLFSIALLYHFVIRVTVNQCSIVYLILFYFILFYFILFYFIFHLFSLFLILL